MKYKLYTAENMLVTRDWTMQFMHLCYQTHTVSIKQQDPNTITINEISSITVNLESNTTH